MMKRNICLVIVTLFLSLAAGAKEKDVVAMQSMVKRLIPAYAENFQFRKIKPIRERLFPPGRFRSPENHNQWQQCQLDGYGTESLLAILLPDHYLLVC